MEKSKLPQKKTSKLYSYEPVANTATFLEDSTMGDTITSCTTVTTTSHILLQR